MGSRGAVSIVQVPLWASEGQRPSIPMACPAEWRALMVRCWAQVPGERPAFRQVVESLRGCFELVRSWPSIDMNAEASSPEPAPEPAPAPAVLEPEPQRSVSEKDTPARGRLRHVTE
jgi:hypothetical protein